MNGNEGCPWRRERVGDDWVGTFQSEVESRKPPWARICWGLSHTSRFRSIWVTGQRYLWASFPITCDLVSMVTRPAVSFLWGRLFYISNKDFFPYSFWECGRTFQAASAQSVLNGLVLRGAGAAFSRLMPTIVQLPQRQTSQQVFGRGGMWASTTAADLSPSLSPKLWVCLLEPSPLAMVLWAKHWVLTLFFI